MLFLVLHRPDDINRIQELDDRETHYNRNWADLELHDGSVKQARKQDKAEEKSKEEKVSDAASFPHKTVSHCLLNQLARRHRNRRADQHAKNPTVVLLDQQNRQRKRRD